METHLKLKIGIILLVLLAPMVLAKTYEEPTNITGFQDLYQWENRQVNNYFGVGILLIVFFTSFVLLKGFENAHAFVGCAFFTAIVSVGCWAVGILEQVWMIGSVIICALIGLLILWSST